MGVWTLEAHLGVVELGAQAGDLSPQFETLPLCLTEEGRHSVQLSLEDDREGQTSVRAGSKVKT